MRETNKARQAFEDYFNLGPGRSLRILQKQYRQQTAPRPPTVRRKTLSLWSKEHDWQRRIAEREAEIQAAVLEGIKHNATEIGYAIFQKRIHDLNRLGELLLGEVLDDEKRWLADVKQIGSGEYAERVDIVRFNSALIEQYRKTLDDIASEMGERIKGFEVNWKQEAARAGIPASEIFERLVAEIIAEMSKTGDAEAT